MQNNGIVKKLAMCLAIFLVLACAFYLSFSFVIKHYDKEAIEFAQGDQLKLSQYQDSIAKEKVWFGYTLKECREKEINLGLDLKGGMNITMEVNVADIIRSMADTTNVSTKGAFNRALAMADSLQESSSDDYTTLFVNSYLEQDPNAKLSVLFSAKVDELSNSSTNEEVISKVKSKVDDAISNAFNVLRTRIDRFGVVQPNIQKLSQTGRILIELPGIKEPERVRKLLQGSANLEFWETYNLQDLAADLRKLDNEYASTHEGDTTLTQRFAQANYAVQPAGAYPVVGRAHYKDTAAINRILTSSEATGILPSDVRFYWTVKAVDDAEAFYDLVALRGIAPALAGDVITDAKADFGQTSAYAEVSMSMDEDGANDWARITGNNLQRCVAIVLDGYVYSFPTVQSKITGGNSQITGNFTIDEAKDLANTLKSGKMPASAKIIQEEVVGPSLGKAAIHDGLWSFALGFVLILLYMIFYYGAIPGLIADFALLCNVFLLVGVLSSFSAVLTLPGIAGIVLTMGMAVDANVLIYERIREEMRSGKGMRQAIHDGFSGAISAIVDANVTSFLTGVILAIFGTGPIRGFAVTYMIGIITSFITAVFITRWLLEAYAAKDNAKPIEFTTKLMKNFLQNTHLNFVNARKVTYILSGVLIIVGILGLDPHIMGRLNLGIDFTGGRNYVVRFDQNVNTEDIETSLNEQFKTQIAEGETFTLDVITFGEDSQVRITTNYRIKEQDEAVDGQIDSLLYAGCNGFMKNSVTFDEFKDTQTNDQVGIMSSQKVGPAIADDIMQSAFWAVLAALLGIFLYILIRFRNFAFSVGAVAGLFHDTVIILGLYALLWQIMPFSMQIDQSFIAAILTVIGYSINDTVVIFDRVRENNKLYPKRDRLQNINDALNATLSRTFSTSMSTFIVLLAIFIFGGASIRGFVFALLLGVVVGTYSSLCIATPLAYDIQQAQDKRKAKKAALNK